MELQMVNEFGTDEEVGDCGQNTISTTWVMWQQGKEVSARHVAMDLGRILVYTKDFPTVGKSAMRSFWRLRPARRGQ